MSEEEGKTEKVPYRPFFADMDQEELYQKDPSLVAKIFLQDLHDHGTDILFEEKLFLRPQTFGGQVFMELRDDENRRFNERFDLKIKIPSFKPISHVNPPEKIDEIEYKGLSELFNQPED